MPSKIPFKTWIKIFLITKFFHVFINLIGYTCRKKYIGLEHLEVLKKNKQNWIYASWHNNVSIGAWELRNQNVAIMVSESVDGEMIARAVHALGNKTIRGSTSRGAVRVFMKMLKWIKQGNNAGITPDGPRGPKYQLQSGVIALAQKAKVPLVPFDIQSTNQWVFEKSWDTHKLPKPFSTMVIHYGEPFYVPPKLSEQELVDISAKFEKIMIDQTKIVDRQIELLKS